MRGQGPGSKWILQGAPVQSGTKPQKPRAQCRAEESSRSPGPRTGSALALEPQVDSTSLCSHQRSEAPATGAASAGSPACSSPSRASAAKTFTVSLKHRSQSRPRRGKRTPHRTASVPLPGEAGSRAPSSGAQPSIPGHLWGPQPLLPSRCSPASFRDEEPQGASSFTRGCHSPCSFLLHPRIQYQAACPAPHPPPSRTLSTLCLNHRELESSHGLTADSGNSLSQIKYTLSF